MTLITSQVSRIVCETGKLSRIDPNQDFYNAGVTSVVALSLLMELESAFSVSIPDDKFIAARTVNALASVIAELSQEMSHP
jgi:acyl carrier protein